jgi:hypothetical protein
MARRGWLRRNRGIETSVLNRPTPLLDRKRVGSAVAMRPNAVRTRCRAGTRAPPGWASTGFRRPVVPGRRVADGIGRGDLIGGARRLHHERVWPSCSRVDPTDVRFADRRSAVTRGAVVTCGVAVTRAAALRPPGSFPVRQLDRRERAAVRRPVAGMGGGGPVGRRDGARARAVRRRDAVAPGRVGRGRAARGCAASGRADGGRPDGGRGDARPNDAGNPSPFGPRCCRRCRPPAGRHPVPLGVATVRARCGRRPLRGPADAGPVNAGRGRAGLPNSASDSVLRKASAVMPSSGGLASGASGPPRDTGLQPVQGAWHVGEQRLSCGRSVRTGRKLLCSKGRRRVGFTPPRPPRMTGRVVFAATRAALSDSHARPAGGRGGVNPTLRRSLEQTRCKPVSRGTAAD